MNYASRTTHLSTTYPGVTFVIARMNEKRRVTREMTISGIRSRLIEKQKALEELINRVTSTESLLTAGEQAIEKAAAEYEATAVPGLVQLPEVQNIAIEYAGMRTLLAALKAERQKVKDLRDAAPAVSGELDKANAEFDSLMYAEWYPAWIRWGLHAIDGLDIDGQKATIDSLIEDGPANLIEEIFKAIQSASGLGADEGPNSNSPGSLGDQAAGATTSSTATSAAPPDGTATATAASTSPAT